ncbi:unnamed protein product [Ixodes persulcatus]
MEVERKRRLAVVALALTSEDEEDLSEPKRACWMKPWMCRKDLGLHSQISSSHNKRFVFFVFNSWRTKVCLLPDLALQLY